MVLKLRKLKMSDAERICKLFSNDNLLKNLAGNLKSEKITLKQEKEFIKNIVSQYNKKKPIEYSLAIIVGGDLVGVIGANKIDWINLNAEIRYWLGEDYWGKGYGTKAIKKFVNTMFKKFKLRRVFATPFSKNKASQRVLEKAGFMLEGERRKSHKKDKQFLNDKLYAIIR